MTGNGSIRVMLSCIACLALPTPIEAGPPSPAKAVARAEKVEPLPERPAAGIISARSAAADAVWSERSGN